MARFETHGSCRAQWQGRLLILRFGETFNLEGIDEVSRFIEETVEQAQHDNWARIEVYECESVLSPLEGIPRIEQDLWHSKNKGCGLFCVVGGNLLARELTIQINGRVGLEAWFGDKLDDAIDYANQFLSHC